VHTSGCFVIPNFGGFDAPVNADFESGFASTLLGVEESVRSAITTGVAGLSIKDATGDSSHLLFSLGEAVERMRAARQAIDRSGGDTPLVGSSGMLFGGQVQHGRDYCSITSLR
jgi:isocitrate lyase